MLGERPLVEQVARHLTARPVVGRLRVGHVELVDRRRDSRQLLGRFEDRRIAPALGGHIEPRDRGVDHLAGAEHRVGVDRLHAAREIDRQHAQHAQAGEHPRTVHLGAGDERTWRRGVPRSGSVDPIPGHPVRQPRRANLVAVRLLGRADISRLVRRRRSELEAAGLRGDDDADGSSPLTRAEVPAVDGHGLHDVHRRRVGDVDLGEGRRHGLRDRGDLGRGERLDPEAARPDHEQPVSGEEELTRPAVVERQRADQA